jgi:hypothetical protein
MNTPSSSVAEGRATLARPSLCSLFAAALILLAAMTASSAEAAPLRPSLIATSPGSPGTSTTPLIKGHADGSISSAVGLSARGGAVTMEIDPNAIVTIYAGDSTCLNPTAIAAEDTVEEFEGPGIEVTVLSNSTTTFYATVTDDSGTSPCSTDSVTYRHVTAAPSMPVLSSVTPASPANDNFPHLIGSADAESTVSIYSSSSCSDPPLASGSAAAFEGLGIQVPVADNSTTTFFARASWGGLPSPCSTASIDYQEVTPAAPPPPSPPSPPLSPPVGSGAARPSSAPPAPPHLRTTPGGIANDNTPLIGGTAPGAAAVRIFTSPDCDGSPVAKGSVAQFEAGLEVQVVDNVAVSFYGVAVGPGGGQSGCSAPVHYIEDSTIPHTRITMGPASKTSKRSAVFRFIDTTEIVPGTTFLCKLDRGKWKRCSSPLHLRRLRARRYVVQVKAIDLAGNAETKAAKRRFKVVPRP